MKEPSGAFKRDGGGDRSGVDGWADLNRTTRACDGRAKAKGRVEQSGLEWTGWTGLDWTRERDRERERESERDSSSGDSEFQLKLSFALPYPMEPFCCHS